MGGEQGLAAAIVAARAAQTALGEAVQTAAGEDQIEALRDALRREFGAALPEDYAEMLRRADGMDFDGLVLYGSWQSEANPGPGGFWQGLIVANTMWREGLGRKGYLVLGETDIDLLTIALDGSNPVLRDKVSGDVNESFRSVGAAIQHLLATRG